MAKLVLFDIDGTLVLGAEREHFAALFLAVEGTYGIDDAERFDVDKAGRTDVEIARLVLERAGLAGETTGKRFDALEETWVEIYRQICPPDLSDRVSPSMPELLSRLAGCDRARLGLLTGNLEEIAHLKLGRAGLATFFENGIGAFGSDEEVRGMLPDVARGRAGAGDEPWPRERTVLIGDTPRDIAAARSGGIRCVAVATGPHGPAELADADAVARDVPELERILLDLTGCG